MGVLRPSQSKLVQRTNSEQTAGRKKGSSTGDCPRSRLRFEQHIIQQGYVRQKYATSLLERQYTNLSAVVYILLCFPSIHCPLSPSISPQNPFWGFMWFQRNCLHQCTLSLGHNDWLRAGPVTRASPSRVTLRALDGNAGTRTTFPP